MCWGLYMGARQLDILSVTVCSNFSFCSFQSPFSTVIQYILVICLHYGLVQSCCTRIASFGSTDPFCVSDFTILSTPRLHSAMSSDFSTFSSHSVVLCWLKDHPHDPFPLQEFTMAIGHDLQGSHVLLQHIAYIKQFWKHGLPSTHRRRHQLYVEDLQPGYRKIWSG